MNVPVKPQQENKAKFKSCPCFKEGTISTFFIIVNIRNIDPLKATNCAALIHTFEELLGMDKP